MDRKTQIGMEIAKRMGDAVSKVRWSRDCECYQARPRAMGDADAALAAAERVEAEIGWPVAVVDPEIFDAAVTA